ncbi:Short-chain dehydrogenase/reductase family protein [Mycena venus]|uniref:Short-chain dehydrogenase/reductase family protein n=1 Tax=Mycena venus TaxID=2733690 RepID=A0A8H7CX47_9AGAR|nr:Short-chain dehydrogenase/reductase family protein [Mycena venus]
MSSTDSPVFLITGCSSGLGRELALTALKSGYRVIATARRIEALSLLEQHGAKVLTLDITSSETELAKFAASAIAIYGRVDYLVNNAGFLQGGAIEEVSPSEALRQFNTNFFGLVNTTNAFLPHFRERRSGTIVNISSQGSSLGTPGGGIYCASKAAVDAVSDTWAHELAEYNIRSISVQPGAFRTEVLKSTNVSLAATFIEGYQLAHGVIDYMGKGAGLEPGDPTKAAESILEFVADPKRKQLPLRFVVGDDAFASLKAFYTQQLADMEATEQWSTGTNYPGIKFQLEHGEHGKGTTSRFETITATASIRIRSQYENRGSPSSSSLSFNLLIQIQWLPTPPPQCSALAAAKERSGLSYTAIAGKIGKSEQHVIDICTGAQKPTTEEFNALAEALDIQNQARKSRRIYRDTELTCR